MPQLSCRVPGGTGGRWRSPRPWPRWRRRNLTTRWLRPQAAHGWRFFPMYVGSQAEFRQLYRPRRQAIRAANDAVADAEQLGFGPRTPVYYDMENFPPRETWRALRFFSAWARRLHDLGFQPGIYSSSSSGIAQLARHYRHRRYVMPDVVHDALWNGDVVRGPRDARDLVPARPGFPGSAAGRRWPPGRPGGWPCSGAAAASTCGSARNPGVRTGMRHATSGAASPDGLAGTCPDLTAAAGEFPYCIRVLPTHNVPAAGALPGPPAPRS